MDAAGARQVAARLAALEGALPLGAQRDASWAPWAAWRSALARAESPSELAPLVRLPLHRLEARIFRSSPTMSSASSLHLHSA